MKDNLLYENINRIMKKKGWIDIPSFGVSMYPLIKEGDVCRFTSINGADNIKEGDIILYVTEEGQLVGHRYLHFFNQDGIRYYVLKGDTNVFWDHPIKSSQMIGKVEYIRKRKLLIRAQGFISKIWGNIAITLPIMPRLCKQYLSLHQRIKIHMKHI